MINEFDNFKLKSKIMFKSITTCLLAAVASALYSANGPVVQLNKNNW